MVWSATTIILSTFVVQVQSKEQEAKRIGNVWPSIDNVIDKVATRKVKNTISAARSFADSFVHRMSQSRQYCHSLMSQQSSFDDATLGKPGNVAISTNKLPPRPAFQPFSHVATHSILLPISSQQSPYVQALHCESRILRHAVAAQASTNSEASGPGRGKKRGARSVGARSAGTGPGPGPEPGPAPVSGSRPGFGAWNLESLGPGPGSSLPGPGPGAGQGQFPGRTQAGRGPAQFEGAMAEQMQALEATFDRSPSSQKERLAMERSLYESMNVQQLRKELANLRGDTGLSIDKDELIQWLEARINGLSQGSSISHGASISDSASNVGKLSSSSVSSNGAHQVREAHIAKDSTAANEAATESAVDKTKQKAFLTHAKSLFEPRDMVIPLADTRVDGRKKVAPSSEAQSSVRSRTTSGAASATNFDIVLCRGDKMRTMFKQMVRGFQEPTWSGWMSNAMSTEWKLQKEEMEGSAGFIEQGNGFVDKERDRLREDEVLPVVAINGEKAACAAALYTPPQTNDADTFHLVKLIRNAGDECKGGAAALLCNLIRNSRNKEGEFSPLKVNPIPNQPDSSRYFQSFGCTEPNPVLRGLDALMGHGMNNFYRPLFCTNPDPPKCEAYADVAFDGGAYFSNIQGPR